MKIALFCYNFPHRKTQDFLFRLFVENFHVSLILAANPVDLKIPPPTVRTKIRSNEGLIHPSKIAEKFGWQYVITEHNSPQTSDIIKSNNIDIAIISGSRILKKNIIDSVNIGIINFHPGLLPEVRGLDALQWALHEGHGIGVTAHLIDHRIDSGLMLLKREIPLHGDDTIFDLSQRLTDIQADMLPQALRKLSEGKEKLLPIGEGTLHGKMPPELEAQLGGILEKRLASIQ